MGVASRPGAAARLDVGSLATKALSDFCSHQAGFQRFPFPKLPDERRCVVRPIDLQSSVQPSPDGDRGKMQINRPIRS